MADRRVFLGWDGSCLPRAARWLREQYAGDGECDLSDVIVALPGARAGRRLLELLADEPGVLAPPVIATAGKLPEYLYEPAQPVAGGLTSLLARTNALRAADPALLALVAPHRPDEEDLEGWLDLARELDRLHESLAAEGVTFADVLDRGRTISDFHEDDRWRALADLHVAYVARLAERRLQDQHAARAQAIAERRCRTERDVVLIATTDVNRITRQMLAQVGDRVTAIIHAPPQEAEHFDEFGCVVVDHWCDRRVEIDDTRWRVVDRPRDQVFAMLQTMGNGGAAGSDGGAPTFNGRFAADQITIGLGDESLAPSIERALELVGVPAHTAIGRPVAHTAPAVLLAGVARWAASSRFDDFASLLRHPNLETWLRATPDAPANTSGDTTGRVIKHWLTLFDQYFTEHLHGRFTGNWLGDASKTARLKAVYDAVRALLPDNADVRRPLPQWSEPIAALLSNVYAPQSFEHHNPHDQLVVRSLEAIASALREQSALDPADALTPVVTFARAIQFTLSRVADQAIPPQMVEAGAAVELLGWLELPLDDAPAMILTGFNEHHIPQSGGADAFLPDRLRRVLGLSDNRRRYARDAAALSAILQSRHDVVLIAGRRGHDDEPLLPSRLLLACDDAKVAERVEAFYPDDAAERRDAPGPLLLQPGGQNRFLIPPPEPQSQPLIKLRVTAFRDYLACPYRFYLKHVAGIKVLDDSAVELQANQFGDLAHEVLRRFARSQVVNAPDSDQVTGWLCAQLDQLKQDRLGDEPTAATVIQVELLRERLNAFARWHVAQLVLGWRTVSKYSEKSLAAELMVDGEPFTITGRIDRVDHHADLGYRIIDYKTSDRGDTPEQAHREGPKNDKQWKDLQLPLYRELWSTLGEAGPVELGFVRLPKDLEQVGYAAATWSDDELCGAVDEAHRIIRNIRAGVFWPPDELTGTMKDYDDVAAICMAESHDWKAVVEASGRRMKQAGAGT